MNLTLVVVGTLGTKPNKLKQLLSNVGIEARIAELQKATILYPARILRHVLEV